MLFRSAKVETIAAPVVTSVVQSFVTSVVVTPLGVAKAEDKVEAVAPVAGAIVETATPPVIKKVLEVTSAPVATPSVSEAKIEVKAENAMSEIAADANAIFAAIDAM